jgi:hypothetical protein
MCESALRLLSSIAATVQQRGLIAVRCAHVLWVCRVQFLHFKTLNCCDAREGEQRLNYVLDRRTFAVYTLPDDGTSLPKHVAVGIWYEVCFVIYFIASC